MKPVVLAAAGAVLALAGLLGPASAADMPEYPIIDTPEPLPIAVGGWYLRGDIGYKVYEDPNAHFDVTDFGNLWSESLDDTGVVGIGVGYKLNDYIRFDTTLDYEFKSGFRGFLNCPGACADPSTTEEADLDAWSGLVNAYVDIGTWYGLTPYVGAGIGASYLTTSGIESTPAGQDYDGDSQWNFAWALMAGTAYQLTDNLLVDVNYRYLNLGDAQSGLVGTTGERVQYDDIAAHEFRVGLRYNLF